MDGVADAQLLGLPEEAVFVDLDDRALTKLGVAPGAVLDAVTTATEVLPTGTATLDGRSLRIDPPAARNSAGGIGSLTFGVGGEVINLADVAEVSRARVDEPSHILRHDGVEAFALGVAGLQSRNIVEVDQAVEARLARAVAQLPVGVEIAPVYRQHRVVDEASQGFLASLALWVGVVIGVLALFMGPRAAVVVGASLLLTVTFLAMYLFDIKVERISLGALIIAMGMLVDNAIVVAEGMETRMRQGEGAA